MLYVKEKLKLSAMVMRLMQNLQKRITRSVCCAGLRCWHAHAERERASLQSTFGRCEKECFGLN